ncbi:hypothetical protein EPO56_01305 [Patescibacteria group bacterium]|nr:MAG: hypothetical protein EPO56_01305 [Patescibacteria group bacterium]
MLYVLVGSDGLKAKERARSLANNAEVLRFGEGGDLFENVLANLSVQPLFGGEICLLLDDPLESDEGRSVLIDQGDLLVASSTLVIAVVPKIDAVSKKKISKSATIELFEERVSLSEPAPSVFKLTDAYAVGDRKNAWILYRELLMAGSAPEEIHGALTWATRSMVLATKTSSASEAGLKPFVFQKAKHAGEKFGAKKVELLSRELMHILHKSRLGGGNLADLLEAFLLKKH